VEFIDLNRFSQSLSQHFKKLLGHFSLHISSDHLKNVYIYFYFLNTLLSTRCDIFLRERINQSKLRYTRFAHINLWEYIQTYLKSQAHPLTGTYT